jgi:hypothetical protein
VLDDRSSSSVAAWLSVRPSIEIISRDRQGLYAEGARISARQARQVADRIHLVQKRREMIERQLDRLERPLRARHSVAVEHENTLSWFRKNDSGATLPVRSPTRGSFFEDKPSRGIVQGGMRGAPHLRRCAAATRACGQPVVPIAPPAAFASHCGVPPLLCGTGRGR